MNVSDEQISRLKNLLGEFKLKEPPKEDFKKTNDVNSLKLVLATIRSKQTEPMTKLGSTVKELTPEPEIDDDFPMVIRWTPEVVDDRGEVINLLMVDGKLCRMYGSKFLPGSGRQPRTHYIWNNNSPFVVQQRKFDERVRLACMIPRERALGPAIKGLLPQFATTR